VLNSVSLREAAEVLRVVISRGNEQEGLEGSSWVKGVTLTARRSLPAFLN
jgi:hypothetical protein